MRDEGFQILENLQKILNLSKNEAKVFHTLIDTSIIEPIEIAKLSGLPRTRVYEVLSKLAARKLIEKKANGGYRLIPPSESISNLSEQYDLDYQQKKRSLYEFGSHLQNLWLKNLASNISPGVELFTYKDAESLFLFHLKNVKNRVLISVASEIAPIDHRKSGSTLAQAYHEGIIVRYLIYSEKLAKTLSSLFDHFVPYKDLKIKIKYNTDLYTSFVILDNIIYIYFFGADSQLETMVLRTSSSQLLKSFDWMFDELWKMGNMI